jgi:S-adenosylmethionine uptake transporter
LHPYLPAIVLICFGEALLSASEGVAKAALMASTPLQVIFFRSLICCAILLPYQIVRGKASLFVPERLAPHVFRVLVNLGAVLAFFESLKHLPLATAATLNLLAPIFMTAIAAFYLREKPNISDIAAVCVAVCGAIIGVVSFEKQEISAVGAAFGVASALLFAISWILVRRIGENDHPVRFLSFLNIGGLIVGSLSLVLDGPVVSARYLSAMLAIGILTLLGQGLTIAAFHRAPVPVLAPLKYTNVIWAMLIGLVFFAEPILLRTLISAVMICAAAFVLVRKYR